ncbi:hypothetical protein FB451DRAFT_1368098 [Mycena latifolia]|nr:hypothetical protein FB451DRAFT_1368098 [Mycena latifolia]
MYSKSIVTSLAVLAVAAPTFAAPVPAPAPNQFIELEARAGLPAGAIGDLAKSLGKGLLSGGAIAGLTSLLGGLAGDDSAPAARELEARAGLPAGALGDLAKSLGKGLLSGGAIAGLTSVLGNIAGGDTPAARDLNARGGLGSLLGKLVGAGEESLESVIKNSVIGGVASGVAVEGVNSAAGQRRASIPAAVVGDAAKAAEKGLGSVISNGLTNGLGTALGGLGISAIADKLFNKRALEDLSDEEVNTLLEYINDMQNGATPAQRRASIPAAVVGDAAKVAEKGIGSVISNGLTNGLGSALGGLGIGALADKLFKLLANAPYSKRALADLSDEEINTLLEYVNDMQNGKRALGSAGKGVAGLLAGLAATQGAESAIEGIKGLFDREVSLNDLD